MLESSLAKILHFFEKKNHFLIIFFNCCNAFHFYIIQIINTTVHRNILSEHFFEEEKFLKSNVHAVLHRMNALVAENRKSKK